MTRRNSITARSTLGRRWIAAGSLDPVAAGALRAHLAALQAIYQAHIGIEDRELFPTAARLLSSSQLSEVGREMAARRARPADLRPPGASSTAS